MSLVQQLKDAVGVEESTNSFECEDCGFAFESGRDEAGYWLSCDECGSDDVVMVED